MPGAAEGRLYIHQTRTQGRVPLCCPDPGPVGRGGGNERTCDKLIVNTGQCLLQLALEGGMSYLV